MPDQPRDDADDTGQPIAELADFEAMPPGGFFERVRSRIDRRMVGSQLLSFWWHGAAAVFFEFLALCFAPFDSKTGGGSQ